MDLFIRASALGLVTALAAGCSGEPDPSAAATQTGAQIALDVDTKTEARGHYSDDTTSILFDLTDEGGSRHAVLQFADGRPLLDSVVVDGVETSKLLGGRVVLSGPTTATEPKRDGDERALTSFAQLPETRLIVTLRDALANAHAAIVAREPSVGARIETKSLAQGWLAPPPASMVIPTWSFWGTTTIHFVNYALHGMGACMRADPVPFIDLYDHTTRCYGIGAAQSSRGVLTPAFTTVRGQWWGAPMRVWNEAGPDSLWVFAE